MSNPMSPQRAVAKRFEFPTGSDIRPTKHDEEQYQSRPQEENTILNATQSPKNQLSITQPTKEPFKEYLI
jgi:hypothetical protein